MKKRGTVAYIMEHVFESPPRDNIDPRALNEYLDLAPSTKPSFVKESLPRKLP